MKHSVSPIQLDGLVYLLSGLLLVVDGLLVNWIPFNDKIGLESALNNLARGM